MKNKFIVIVLIIIVAVGTYFFLNRDPEVIVTNFEECLAAGNPAMESYPRQCRHGEETFVENIGNELEKIDLIRLDSPRPNQKINSPLMISGQARGFWFFEADFPVVLTNWDGLVIAEGIATAKGDWMTEEFVPFEATLTFDVEENDYSNKGSLILQRDNPSDLSENNDALEVPIFFVFTPDEDIVTSADNAPPGSMHNLPVPNAVSAVRAKVATDLGISEGVVIIMTAYEKTWTNGCLDLAEEGEMCTEALVQGYEVTVQAQGKEYIYHTNADGKILRENK